MIQARANEQVGIEQIGGMLTMVGFMWTEAVAERARLSEDNASLKEQLAEAEAASRTKCVALLLWSFSCDQKSLCEAGICEHGTYQACAEYLVDEFDRSEAAKGGRDE